MPATRRLALAILLLALPSACHETHIDYSAGESGEIRLFDDLYSVSVPDPQHAVAVGYYGAAYWTEDGGESWFLGQTDTQASLYNVSMADAQHGWAVGQRGLILRTEDGGRTWKRQPNLKEQEGTHLFSVAALDADTAWTVGEWGTRLGTTDGGETWFDNSFSVDERHPQFVWLSPFEQEKVRRGEKVYEDVNVNDITCVAQKNRCWLIGEFGYIFYSEDGGQSWIRSAIEGSATIEPVQMPYNTLRVPKKDIARLRAFADKIKDQGHLNVAVESMASPAEVREFGDPNDPYELFEILEARSQEVRSVLEGAGLPTDRVRLRGQPPWDYEEYLESDPEFLERYLSGQTREQGEVHVRVIQNPILFTVSFEDGERGIITGLGGVVLRTEDGGQTWVYRRIERKQAVFAAGVSDTRTVAVGEKGLVRVSTDHGDTWAPPSPGNFPNVFTYMRDIDFTADGSVGFIVGQSGMVLRSRDAGFSWERVLPPEDRV